MDKKMKRKLLLAGLGLGLTFTEAYLQNKISKNKDEKIEKLITEVRNELGGSRIEITPKRINMSVEKLDVVDGADLTLDTNEITVSKHEKQFNTLNSKVGTIEEGLSNRLERLENEVFAPVEDTDESVSYQPIYGHRYSDEENTSDKSLVLSEEDGAQDMTMKEYHDLSESANKLVGRLDEDYLKKLHVNLLEGSFVYNMKDFHSLVAQLYMVQEASKKKEDE